MALYLRHFSRVHEEYQIVDIPDTVTSPMTDPSTLLSQGTVVRSFGESDYTHEDPVRLLTKVESLLAGLPAPQE